jgi:hypothetical protein
LPADLADILCMCEGKMKKKILNRKFFELFKTNPPRKIELEEFGILLLIEENDRGSYCIMNET